MMMMGIRRSSYCCGYSLLFFLLVVSLSWNSVQSASPWRPVRVLTKPRSFRLTIPLTTTTQPTTPTLPSTTILHTYHHRLSNRVQCLWNKLWTLLTQWSVSCNWKAFSWTLTRQQRQQPDDDTKGNNNRLSSSLVTVHRGGFSLKTNRQNLHQKKKSSVPPSSKNSKINKQKRHTLLPNNYRPSKTVVRYSLVASLMVAVLWMSRASWAPYLLDKQAIQDRTLHVLEQLQFDPTAPLATKLTSMALYILGLTLWEALGLSTIPVETAAGMVFGRLGLCMSLSGKLLGASLCWMVGRTVLPSERITSYNKIFALLKDSTHSPLLTAFLFKFSCFPETLKNLGSAVLPNVRYWMFLLVTLLHGGLFTCIWTLLGMDTAQRLVVPDTPVSYQLKTALIFSGVTAFLCTPLTMAWWIRDMQKTTRGTSSKQQQQPVRRWYEPSLVEIWLMGILATFLLSLF